MKPLFVILTLVMLASSVSLIAQMTTPRVLALRILDSDGSSLPDITDELQLQVSLKGIVRTEKDISFGFAHGLGDVYAKIQLGNFGFEWAPGDTVDVTVTRNSIPYSKAHVRIVIPPGTYTMYWGRQDTPDREYPGEPVRLFPFVLKVVSEPDTPSTILRNGAATELKLGEQSLSGEKDLTGVFSLAPPPIGWRWEPARHFVSLRDFEFSETAYTDADGAAQPGWARTLEFRLVPEE